MKPLGPRELQEIEKVIGGAVQGEPPVVVGGIMARILKGIESLGRTVDEVLGLDNPELNNSYVDKEGKLLPKGKSR